MATWFLINTISLTGTKYLPGHVFDDTKVPSSTLVAAGGELWPTGDAIVGAMAARVTSAHANQGINEAEMESRMRAATEASLSISGNVFTYTEGATSGGSIFSSFGAAMDAAVRCGTVCRLVVNTANVPSPTVFTGSLGALDLSLIDIVGTTISNDSGTYSILTFQTGTTVAKFRRLERVMLRSTSASPVCTVTGAKFAWVSMSDQAFVVGGSSAPFFQVGSGANLLFIMENSSLSNGTQRVIQADAGGTAWLTLGNLAAYGTTCLGGAGAFNVGVNSPSAQVPASQSNVSGTYTVSYTCLQSRIAPTVSTTVGRPAAPVVGQQDFDTTVGKPVWWNGASWIDAAGNVV